MEYTPIFEPVVPTEAILQPAADVVVFTRPRPRLVRCGNFTLDRATGAIRWRGEQLYLASEQHELLDVMLRHAGQILSRERLAGLIGTTVDAIDTRMQALRTELELIGVNSWLPRKVEGSGYILWR